MAKVREGGRERRMCGWRGKKGWVDQGKGIKGGWPWRERRKCRGEREGGRRRIKGGGKERKRG